MFAKKLVPKLIYHIETSYFVYFALQLSRIRWMSLAWLNKP